MSFHDNMLMLTMVIIAVDSQRFYHRIYFKYVKCWNGQFVLEFTNLSWGSAFEYMLLGDLSIWLLVSWWIISAMLFCTVNQVKGGSSKQKCFPFMLVLFIRKCLFGNVTCWQMKIDFVFWWARFSLIVCIQNTLLLGNCSWIVIQKWTSIRLPIQWQCKILHS